jgi:hypothetical protein
MARRRCSRLWGAYGEHRRCKRPAAFEIVKGIWRGHYICKRCREELGYPLEYLQPVASRRQDT